MTFSDIGLYGKPSAGLIIIVDNEFCVIRKAEQILGRWLLYTDEKGVLVVYNR